MPPLLVEALDAFWLLEAGVSLTEQGWCDEHGQAPMLFLAWLKAVRGVVAEVRRDAQPAPQPPSPVR